MEEGLTIFDYKRIRELSWSLANNGYGLNPLSHMLPYQRLMLIIL